MLNSFSRLLRPLSGLCLGLFLLGLPALNGCAGREKAEGEAKVDAYRVKITNDSSTDIRYRYSRLVPHQARHPVPGEPQPQATLDVGVVFETIPPGEHTTITVKPGKQVTLIIVRKGVDTRRRFTVDHSMDVHVTPTGIFEYMNDDRVLIKVE